MRFLIIAFALFSSNLVHSKCIDKYDRDLYPHWSKSDDYFINIREKIIAQHVEENLELKDGKVIGGLLLDEYTGNNLRVGIDSIHLDHIVTLKFAHENGADCWPKSMREQFANDPLNLIPVSAGSNLRKGWDLFDYLPPKLTFCADYLARIQAVYNKYPLTITKSQLSRYERLKGRCSDLKKGIKINKQLDWLRGLF